MNIIESLKKFKDSLNEFFDPTMQEYSPGKRDYGQLPEHLQQCLEAIPPVKAWSVKCYPCLVELLDGRQIDHVYIASAEDFISAGFGAWPEDIVTDNEQTLRITDIKTMRLSSTRLSPQIADKIYAGGEKGMGWFCFTFCFNDNTQQTYEVASRNIDFIILPDNRNIKDIVDVVVHKKVTPVIQLQDPKYTWALYGSGENNGKAWYGLGVKFSPQAKIRLVRGKERNS